MHSTGPALRRISTVQPNKDGGTVIQGPFAYRDTSHRGLRHETWHEHGAYSYRAGLAATPGQLEAALGFVQERYKAAGYRRPETLAPRATDSVTAIALRDKATIGTISLWRDGSGGLQADEIYGRELDELRCRGGYIGEFGRLAMDQETPFLPLLSALVSKLIHVGSREWQLTDFVVECNPRHVSFYTRLMGFSVIGDTRNCTQVDAPAVLLHLGAMQLQSLASLCDETPVKGLKNNVYQLNITRSANLADKALAQA